MAHVSWQASEINFIETDLADVQPSISNRCKKCTRLYPTPNPDFPMPNLVNKQTYAQGKQPGYVCCLSTCFLAVPSSQSNELFQHRLCGPHLRAHDHLGVQSSALFLLIKTGVFS